MCQVELISFSLDNTIINMKQLLIFAFIILVNYTVKSQPFNQPDSAIVSNLIAAREHNICRLMRKAKFTDTYKIINVYSLSYKAFSLNKEIKKEDIKNPGFFKNLYCNYYQGYKSKIFEIEADSYIIDSLNYIIAVSDGKFIYWRKGIGIGDPEDNQLINIYLKGKGEYIFRLSGTDMGFRFISFGKNLYAYYYKSIENGQVKKITMDELVDVYWKNFIP